VVSTHHYTYVTFLDCVDQAMFSGNPARPETAQVRFEWFGFAQAVERLALDGPDQQIDSFEACLVVLLEPEIVVPALRRELDVDSSMSCLTLVFPARKLPEIHVIPVWFMPLPWPCAD